MTISMPENVLSASDARKGLNATLERFRREGVNAEPVVFGSHRKPEAVMIPYVRYQQLLIDVLPLEGAEVEYEGPVRSYTTPRSLGGHMSVAEMKKFLADEDLAHYIRVTESLQ